MKPDKTQINSLVKELEKRHRDKLDFLRNEAEKFSRFIKALPAFRGVVVEGQLKYNGEC